ncbi:interferon-induced very large GTPase 1-like [Apostichopus japonicus]|uniref:interferon-induced very large GTPase 1-like n=1 Tax=Stichopus japonicus TaxID=307972 RepID=UPI003AB59DC7
MSTIKEAKPNLLKDKDDSIKLHHTSKVVIHPLRGLCVNTHDKSYLTTPRGTLAYLSLENYEIPNDSEISVTWNFFDFDSEQLYLSLCTYGHTNLLQDVPIPTSSTIWEGIKYMSKVKHTWYMNKSYEGDPSQVRLAENPIQVLKAIAQQLNQVQPVDDVKREISSFIDAFGSHVSMGPFATGGRSVAKVSICNFQSNNKQNVWRLLENEFESFNTEDVDVFFTDEKGHLIPFQRTAVRDETAKFEKQLCLFGGSKPFTDVNQWRRDLATSSLVISGDLSESSLLPVWEILKKSKHDCTDYLEAICDLLQDVWFKSQEVTEGLRISLTTKGLLPAMMLPQTNVAPSSSRIAEDSSNVFSNTVSSYPKIVTDLQLSNLKQGIWNATTLRTSTWKVDDFTGNAVMWQFVKTIFSLDCRGRKCLKMPTLASQPASIEHKHDGSDIFDLFDCNNCEHKIQHELISAMDVTLAILHCCDPFLRQELLWKMAQCRLAVPILLPYLDTKDTKTEIQLWGLRKVYKSWTHTANKSHVEACMIDYPLPIVSLLRLGDIRMSKSRLLNKILGKLQGHNDHTYFVDVNEEPPCAKWSKGTVEAAWYLPEDTIDPQNDSTLQDAVSFFNLRGNAFDHPVQTEFVCRASNVLIILVEEKNQDKFLDEIKRLSEIVDGHLICLISSTNHERMCKTYNGVKRTLIFSQPFLADTGAEICRKLNMVLWSHDDGRRQHRFHTIYSLKNLCKELDIDIDEGAKGCVAGKKLAKDIITSIRQSPDNYKVKHLPLQGKMWQKWSRLDKKWNKGYDNQFTSVEHYQANLRNQLTEVREQQHKTALSGDVLKFIEAMKRPFTTRRYFVAWLSFYLNDNCHEKLEPLRMELEKIQDESRVARAEKSKLKDNENIDDEIKARITLLVEREISLQVRASKVFNQIGADSLGTEHFVREIAQHYEAYDEMKKMKMESVNSTIDSESLPDVAVSHLLDGYPLEILNGEVGQVPLGWLKAVFRSLIKRLGNAKLCAISVLGIQSSGKSTLLNCMFGVRFAVSAGRCTRGVFIQLLKVDEEIQKEINCQYVLVIDTEGLKAPERSHGYDIRYDNELATFALCLADVTIINIAGQTLGKDMTDILQIAAHAFIRMKEVNIKSTCRIVQQFVADIGAVDKNKEGTQAILETLDEAISAAATEEGYSDLYSRFSDVFNLKRNEEVQYIPSLWQGAMAPPNHRYSEKILKLKGVLFSDLRHSGKTFEQFLERLKIVWIAIKEENFIFSFQNCVAAVQYKIFQHSYGTWVGEMRRTIMEWESNAKQKIKSVSTNVTQNTKQELKKEISDVVDEAATKVAKLVKSYMSDNTHAEYYQLNKYKDEFLLDLNVTQRMFTQDAREALDTIAESIVQRNQMEVLLPKCKNELRQNAKTEAVKLRQIHVDAASFGDIPINEINKTFDKLWDTWVIDISKKYPPRNVEQNAVQREFDLYLVNAGEKYDLTNGIKERLLKKEKPLLKRVMKSSVGYFKPLDHTEVAENIIASSLHNLQLEIDDDMAYETQLKQNLIDSAINALNKKYDGASLTQEVKFQTMVTLCQKAVPIIYKGRIQYNERYSLRELLAKEKENLRMDFIALCSSSFQDKRVSESLLELLNITMKEVIANYLGPAVYRAVLEECPYFASKFAMFGNILEDMAQREDFSSYSSFLFDLEKFLEKWSLNKIAEVCAREQGDLSFLHHLVERKVVDIQGKLLECISTCNSSLLEVPDDRKPFHEWVKQFCQDTKRRIPNLHLPDDDMKNLLLFDVKDLGFFSEEVRKYVADQLTVDMLKRFTLPKPGQVDVTEQVLLKLPDKPHLAIMKHVTGCTEQCPICHVPCDNMTRQHEKHRAELHYPEGVIGCATGPHGRLVCSICTSIVTTDETYYDGRNYKKYKNHQKDFPNWIIQPIQNDSPIKYWQWVMNRFNEDFAQLYGHREAKLPHGWTKITKQEAIEDLRQAYATNTRAEHASRN